MDKLEIENLIIEQINKSCKLGEQTGGSGHKAHVDACVHNIEQEDQEDSSIKVTYQYSIFRESEFTVHEENDPEPDIFENEMIIRDNKVISNKQTRVIQSSFEPIPMPEFPSKEDKYWFDRLDVSYDKGYTKEETKNAIEYFHAKKDFPTYLLTPRESFDLNIFHKSIWESHLKVLVKN